MFETSGDGVGDAEWFQEITLISKEGEEVAWAVA